MSDPNSTSGAIPTDSLGSHTPGPWSVWPRNHLCIEAPSGNIALCNLARNSAADARLIASAPEMFELLKKYAYDGRLQSFEDREGFRKDALTLIAKVEGRS